MQTLYYHITAKSAPFLNYLLRKRLEKGKEDPARYLEKAGIITKPRPTGALVWIHAASVGEAQSALIMMDRCLAQHPNIQIMLTTGTLSSAKLMEQRLPPNAFHQFYPLDHPQWVKTFLDHWQPDFVLWMESELWPNMLAEIKNREIPAFLVNARLSPKSFRSWLYVKRFARELLSPFHHILCQTEQDQTRYEQLGAKSCIVTDNIKYSANPLGFDKGDFETLSKAIYSRPVWLLASTHAGEEEMACRIHEILKTRYPDLLTIIIPRHPERRDEILKSCAQFHVKIRLRGDAKKKPLADDDIYIADTLGELGLFYRLVPLAFIGRSLSDDGGGGHNPVEAAQLGCAVVHGTHVQNLQEIYDDMDSYGAAQIVHDQAALTGLLAVLLDNHKHLQDLQNTALKFSKEKSGAIERTMQAINPALNNVIAEIKVTRGNAPPQTGGQNAAQNA